MVTTRSSRGALSDAGNTKKWTILGKRSTHVPGTSSGSTTAPSAPKRALQNSTTRDAQIDRCGFERRRVQNRIDSADVPSHFVTDIYEYQLWLEAHHLIEEPILPDEIEQPEEVSARHRVVLVDWIIQVHNHAFHSGHLGAETLHLAVHLLDTYLKRVGATKSDLQLVGVVAVLVATKYEEIYAPELAELIEVSGNAVTRAQIVDYEKRLLRAVHFELQRPSPLSFIGMFAGEPFKKQHTSLAKCLADSFVLSLHYSARKPSQIALASLLIAHLALGENPVNRSEIDRIFTKIDWDAVSATARQIITSFLRFGAHARFGGWRDKYARHPHGAVAKFASIAELMPRLQAISALPLFV